MDYESVVQSAALQLAFETTFRIEIAAALNISMDHIVIVSLTPGSVDVQFDIFVPDTPSRNSDGAAASTAGAVAMLKKELIEQVSSPTSVLNTQSTYARLSTGTIVVEIVVKEETLDEDVKEETLDEDENEDKPIIDKKAGVGNTGIPNLALSISLSVGTLLLLFAIYYFMKKRKERKKSEKSARRVGPSHDDGKANNAIDAMEMQGVELAELDRVDVMENVMEIMDQVKALEDQQDSCEENLKSLAQEAAIQGRNLSLQLTEERQHHQLRLEERLKKRKAPVPSPKLAGPKPAPPLTRLYEESI
jgi:hypothetical protein